MATATARRLLACRLNDAFGTSFEWVPDSQTLLPAPCPPAGVRRPLPTAAPTGPTVQENGGGKKPAARTYQDLLKNPADERIFDYYATSQLVKVSLADGNRSPWASPA